MTLIQPRDFTEPAGAEIATEVVGPTITEMYAAGIVTEVTNPVTAIPTEVIKVVGNFAIELEGRREELTPDQVFILNALLCARGKEVSRKDIDHLGFREGEKKTVLDRAYHTARRRLEQLALPEAGVVVQANGSTSARLYRFNPKVTVEEARLDVTGVASAAKISFITERERKAATPPAERTPKKLKKTRSAPEAGPSKDELDIIRLYLSDIGNVPLLTAEDEKHLAQAVEAGREAQARLAAEDLSPAQKRQLRQQIQAGREAHDQFVEANLRLVVSIAKKYRTSGMALEDLIQEGNLGVMHAVDKFDWRKGFKFSTYSTWWIRQAITRAIADQKRTIRLPVHMNDKLAALFKARRQLTEGLGREPTLDELAKQLEMTPQKVQELILLDRMPESLDRSLSDEPGSASMGDMVGSTEAALDFEAALQSVAGQELLMLIEHSSLEERSRNVLRLRHGIGCEPHTLEEVGKIMGITRERVRQIEKQAYSTLRSSRVSVRKEDWLYD